MVTTRHCVACVLLCAFISGAAAQAGDCEKSLVDLVTEQGLTFTPQAVNLAGLAPFVNNDTAELTIFAPIDDAFLAALTLFPDLNITALLENIAFLHELIGYHIVPGKLLSTDLEDGMTLETTIADMSSCGNDTVLVKVNDDGVVIEGGFTSGKVITPDIEICNSVIHIVDGLIAPCMDITPPDFDPDADENGDGRGDGDGR